MEWWSDEFMQRHVSMMSYNRWSFNATHSCKMCRLVSSTKLWDYFILRCWIVEESHFNYADQTAPSGPGWSVEHGTGLVQYNVVRYTGSDQLPIANLSVFRPVPCNRDLSETSVSVILTVLLGNLFVIQCHKTLNHLSKNEQHLQRHCLIW